jgi:hypothetical protein
MMQDKTAIENNENANTPSKAFREYIESLVEEVVLNGATLNDHKKYLQRYSQEEGVDYDVLEKKLIEFFETIEELKPKESKAIERLAKMLGKDCYLEENKVDELVLAVNKAREEAKRKAKERRNGYGECDYGNGRYEGNFKDGKFNGFGTLYFDDGSKYVGNWKDDNCWGRGTLYNSDGTKKYEGNYENSLRHGRGILYYDNGNRYEGNWKKGIRDGQGTFYWADGDVDHGKWIDDKREGEFIRTKADGRKLTATYNNDEIIGKWKENGSQASASISLLCPIEGIVFGETKTSDMPRLGYKKCFNEYTEKYYWSLSGLDVYDDNGDQYVDHLLMEKRDRLSSKLIDLGFDFGLSYNQCMSLLRRLGFTIDVKEEPHTVFFAGRNTLEAVLKATSPDGQIAIMFAFRFGNYNGEGYSVDSRNSLDVMHINYLGNGNTN